MLTSRQLDLRHLYPTIGYSRASWCRCALLLYSVLWLLIGLLAPLWAQETGPAPLQPSLQGTEPRTGLPASPSQIPSSSLPTRNVSSVEDKSKGPPPKPPQPDAFNDFHRPSLITQAFVLVLFSLLPFIVMILTSFLKIVIVLSLLRSALGVQQAPPNQVINGVAFMLSMFVMYPTVLQMYDITQKAVQEEAPPESITSPNSANYILKIASYTAEPLREFLKRNSSVKHQGIFYRMAYRVLPASHRPDLKPDDFIILVPSYITGQLKDAFEIGVLIYIPFFVIDLVTSNVLLAMGMMMLSPVTISMPLKLFLLVMLDGWTLLVEGLVSTFR